MADRLLTKDEIAGELRKLGGPDSNVAGYVIGDFEITRLIDGRSVGYRTADLLMPMCEFSRRTLLPLIKYPIRHTPQQSIEAEVALSGDALGPRVVNAYRVPRPEDVRGETHGDYTIMAQHIQAVKQVLHSGRQWPEMSTDKKEALELIATKIGRIIDGDPNHVDHWDDIIGYAKLAKDRIKHA